MTDSHNKVLDNLKHNIQRNLQDWRTGDQSDSESLHLENDSDQTSASVTLLDWETFSEADQVEADTQVAEYGEESYENYEEYDTDQGYGVAPVGQNFDAKGNYIFFCWVVVSLNCTWGKGLIGVEFDLS